MTDKRRGLGRGLGALIPTEASNRARPSDVFFHDQARRTAPGGAEDDGADDQGGLQEPAKPASSGEMTESAMLRPVPGAEFTELALDDIVPNHRQPREVFDDDELAELAHSIAEIGVLQPVVVRPLENDSSDTPGRHSVDGPEALVGARQGTAKYELVMGERRWRASRLAGLDRVPAIVKHTQDEDLLRDALLENLHRSQLNALEEGAAYQQLLQDFGCTHDDLATRLGRSRPQISNTIRLLNLPPLVGRRVAAGVLSAGHARALLGLGDGAAMERLAQRIVAEGLSVRATEEIVSSGVDSPAEAQRTRRRVDVDPRLDDLAARMSDRLDTCVTVAMGRRRGKLTVEFASVDDLDRILAALESDRSLLSTVPGHPLPSK